MATNNTIHASVEEDFLAGATLVDENERVDSPNDPEPMVAASNATATTPDRLVESLDLSKASSEEFQELLKSYEMMMEASDLLAQVLISDVMRRLGGDNGPISCEAKAVKRCHDRAEKRLAAAYDAVAEATKRHANTPRGFSQPNEEGDVGIVDCSETSFMDFFDAIDAVDMVVTPGPDICLVGVNLKKLHLALAVERCRRALSKKAKPEERWLTKKPDGSYDIRGTFGRAAEDGTHPSANESKTTTSR